MSDAFEYRPKFVDIRASKKGAKTAARPEPAAKRACDHIGCKQPGAHKAPKSRDRQNEYWHFCLDHVAEYNRRWNYFSGMSDSEFEEYKAREEVGHRPTWTFRAAKGDRMAAAARGFQPGKRAADPFNMFNPDAAGAAPPPKASRRMTRLQTLALEVMSLEHTADGPQIRARYAELVKQWHPDSNGGDRGAESNLQRVVQAYQTLKSGGLV